ncbi:MAG: phosphatidate cytidylyltransferase [Lachnospiraceae bacterium]|nr:phosphatidate cytidylyltransferase [Lachnospiraceae bacterium]
MVRTRIISGAVLVLLAILTILPGGYILAATLWGISMIAYRELCSACHILGEEARGNNLVTAGYLFISLYYFFMAAFSDRTYLVFCVVMAMIAQLFVYVFTFPRFQAQQVMGAYFSFIYAPVMFSFVYLTRQLPQGLYLVWMIFVGSWISDTCAYTVGMLFGKHRLAPVLSPKKSVEGCLGGIVGSALVGGILGYVLFLGMSLSSTTIWVCALLGAMGSMVSQIGDLAASAIKRNYEIKDYSSLIPGHGGIMDRFDSVIITAPIVYFMCVLLL